MSMPVEQNNHSISLQTRVLISLRYKTITKAINREFWNSSSDTSNSFYVGSYGRGTAVDTSDLDVLVELPNDQYDRFNSPYGNGPSRLLQTVKNAVLESYPRSDVKGDGQVVVINFSDGIKFEILPAFRKLSYIGIWDGTYKYPDTHMGGNWMSTNPKAEQKAMKKRMGLMSLTDCSMIHASTSDISTMSTFPVTTFQVFLLILLSIRLLVIGTGTEIIMRQVDQKGEIMNGFCSITIMQSV